MSGNSNSKGRGKSESAEQPVIFAGIDGANDREAGSGNEPLVTDGIGDATNSGNGESASGVGTANELGHAGIAGGISGQDGRANVGSNGSAGSSGNGKRGRGRPAGSGRDGQSGERQSTSGSNSGSGDTSTETEKLAATPANNVKAPKVGGFDKSGVVVTAPITGKFKKGYRPLMDKKESVQTAEGMFAMASLALGSHFALDDEEADALGSAMARVFEKFPVKVGENPEMLEKILALQGLAVVASLITIPRLRQTMRGKNDGVIQQIVEKRVERAAAESEFGASNGNAITNAGASLSNDIDEFAGAFNLAS